MLYLLWTILNIGLFFFFIIIFLPVLKHIRERFGLFTAIVFVFGLSQCNRSSNDGSYNRTVKLYHEENKLFTNQRSTFLTLDHNLLFKVKMSISYNRNKDSSITPLSAYTYINGFTAGQQWNLETISVNVSDTKVNYLVYGTIKWSLWNITLFTERKVYAGSINAS